MNHGDSVDHIVDVAELSCRGTQELAAGRNIEEQIKDLHHGSWCAGRGLREVAVFTRDFQGRGIFAAGPTAQAQSAH